MVEFIKDSIHGLKDLDIKNIDLAYIKDLEIKINADFATVKRGEKSITEFRDIITAEKICVMELLYRIDTVIREFVKEINGPQEWPTYEHKPEKDIIEQSVLGAVIHPYLEYTGVQTKSSNITLEEAKKNTH